MPYLDKIKIECKADDTLPLSALSDFQGGLRTRSDHDITNLKNKIIEVGFSYPFFVWLHDEKNYCLDGHGRILALKSLEEDGYELPEEFPVVFIYAEDMTEAKKKLLQAASSYGVITNAGLAELTDGLNIDLKDLTFANEYIDFSGEVFTEKGEFSVQSNPFKIAKFRKYKIPVSENEIALFLGALADHEAKTGSKEGFFKAVFEGNLEEEDSEEELEEDQENLSDAPDKQQEIC
jgi:hypothetical protein